MASDDICTWIKIAAADSNFIKEITQKNWHFNRHTKKML